MARGCYQHGFSGGSHLGQSADLHRMPFEPSAPCEQRKQTCGASAVEVHHPSLELRILVTLHARILTWLILSHTKR